MKKSLFAMAYCFAFGLSGCTGKIDDGKPKEKVTRTTTVTEKREKPVPVYQTVTQIKSATKTESNTGEVAPLHGATVNGTKLPEPGK